MRPNRKAITRRTFLESSVAAITVPYIACPSVLGKGSRPAPSNQITMGLIGLGSMGMRHVKGFLQEDDCRLIAVCDVDAGRRDAAVEEINKHYGSDGCGQYNDFRDLIARGDIDTLFGPGPLAFYPGNYGSPRRQGYLR